MAALSPLRAVLSLAVLTVGLPNPQSAPAQGPPEPIAVANAGPTPLPLGTTRGERVNRLVIRGATVVSGRGTP